MDDLPNLLQRDYGLKPQGKSAPMSTQRSTQARISGVQTVYDDVFGGPPKFTAPSFASQSQEGYDDIFRSYSTPIKNSSVPVFDAPVYDDDIFGGLKGIRNSAVPYDDVFSGGSAGGGLSSAPFEDLLGPKNSNSQRSGGNQGGSGFEDLIPGFNISESANKTRSAGESRAKHRVPTASPRKPAEDPFVVLEPELSSNSSSTLLPDSLEKLNMPSQPTTTSTKERKASSNGTMGIDNITAFDGFSVTRGTASSPMSKSSIAKSPLKTSHGASPSHSSINTESVEGKSVKRSSVINNSVKDHSKAHGSVPRTDIRKSSGKTDLSSKFSSPRRYRQPLHENSTYVSNLKRSSPPRKSERGANFFNEVLVTVGEVKLLTKPTPYPPPSRPPPPLVIKQGPSSKKTAEMSDTAGHSNSFHSHQPHSGKTVKSSSIQELEDFVSGGSRGQIGGDPLSHCIDGKVDGSFAAAASTAAMKEAMERAEARINQAKEARGNWEREVKAGKSQEREKHDRRDASVAEGIQGQEEKERVVKATREAREQEDKEKAAQAAREAREQEEHERERRQREKEREKEREREREREREKDRVAVERATQEARQRAERAAVERATAEARERAAAEARERVERVAVERAAAERAAVERAAAEARERAAAEARERAAAEVKERAAAERAAAERAAALVRERPASERVGSERTSTDARLRADRAAVERANAEARERAAERAAVERAAAEARERAERAVAERAAAAKERQRRNDNDLESFFGMGARTDSAPRQRTGTSDATADVQSQNRGFSGEGSQRTSAGTPQSHRRSNLATNAADDWTSLFTAPSSEEFQEIPGETADRRRARLERHQRTLERAAKALAQKNDRDLQAQREQAEKNRLAETVDAEIKRWATGKEGNLRALLSTMQYILWPESGWQPVSLTDVITSASVKKVYRKATLCVHPDKVQQKGATIQQKYIAEKVFDLLKEAWNKFNSEELL